ncbi:phosphatidylserine/phosphatidylglycerophosphate/cardiolipin synthase family protein [Candidatus Pacearchaeota archaeon]|nr:phosphatidylserine/phosphatidylglycerophosphate/cardiolipin synthase family protein [Candidatus Pacearchaeota archaeon]
MKEQFQIISKPRELYDEMIKDILNAKKQIFLETYIYEDDQVGVRFREALLKKAKQGVKIKLLLDAWGSSVKKHYFEELIANGAEVKLFREIKYLIRIFSKNHERSHRKLLIIDNNIVYVGSANITYRYIDSRELVIRLIGDITNSFIKSFQRVWNNHSDHITHKKLKSIFHEEFEIINDIPSYYWRITESKYVKLIKNAKKSILIETPYFIPSTRIRKVLGKAVKRGVKVNIIIPYNSNVAVVDTLRNRYLGNLYKNGIKLFYYKPTLLHSKLMIVDDDFFLLGSSNLDYRSLLYLYEINFLGKDKRIIKSLKEYFNETIKGTIPFDYGEWRKRSSFKRILEMILYRVRHYL